MVEKLRDHYISTFATVGNIFAYTFYIESKEIYKVYFS